MDRPSLPQAEQASVLRRILQLLGICLRARRLVLGTDAALAAAAQGTAKLLLLATDAGANVNKKCRDKCAFYHIPMYTVGTKSDLGHACGRSQVVVVAVTDPGLAAKIASMAGEFGGGEVF